MPIDAMVAGAGIWGCMVARRLAGCKVMVLERWPVGGGGLRCECAVGLSSWEADFQQVT